MSAGPRTITVYEALARALIIIQDEWGGSAVEAAEMIEHEDTGSYVGEAASRYVESVRIACTFRSPAAS